MYKKLNDSRREEDLSSYQSKFQSLQNEIISNKELMAASVSS